MAENIQVNSLDSAVSQLCKLTDNLSPGTFVLGQKTCNFSKTLLKTGLLSYSTKTKLTISEGDKKKVITIAAVHDDHNRHLKFKRRNVNRIKRISGLSHSKSNILRKYKSLLGLHESCCSSKIKYHKLATKILQQHNGSTNPNAFPEPSDSQNTNLTSQTSNVACDYSSKISDQTSINQCTQPISGKLMVLSADGKLHPLKMSSNISCSPKGKDNLFLLPVSSSGQIIQAKLQNEFTSQKSIDVSKLYASRRNFMRRKQGESNVFQNETPEEQNCDVLGSCINLGKMKSELKVEKPENDIHHVGHHQLYSSTRGYMKSKANPSEEPHISNELDKQIQNDTNNKILEKAILGSKISYPPNMCAVNNRTSTNQCCSPVKNDTSAITANITIPVSEIDSNVNKSPQGKFLLSNSVILDDSPVRSKECETNASKPDNFFAFYEIAKKIAKFIEVNKTNSISKHLSCSIVSDNSPLATNSSFATEIDTNKLYASARKYVSKSMQNKVPCQPVDSDCINCVGTNEHCVSCIGHSKNLNTLDKNSLSQSHMEHKVKENTENNFDCVEQVVTTAQDSECSSKSVSNNLLKNTDSQTEVQSEQDKNMGNMNYCENLERLPHIEKNSLLAEKSIIVVPVEHEKPDDISQRLFNATDDNCYFSNSSSLYEVLCEPTVSNEVISHKEQGNKVSGKILHQINSDLPSNNLLQLENSLYKLHSSDINSYQNSSCQVGSETHYNVSNANESDFDSENIEKCLLLPSDAEDLCVDVSAGDLILPNSKNIVKIDRKGKSEASCKTKKYSASLNDEIDPHATDNDLLCSMKKSNVDDNSSDKKNEFNCHPNAKGDFSNCDVNNFHLNTSASSETSVCFSNIEKKLLPEIISDKSQIETSVKNNDQLDEYCQTIKNLLDVSQDMSKKKLSQANNNENDLQDQDVDIKNLSKRKGTKNMSRKTKCKIVQEKSNSKVNFQSKKKNKIPQCKFISIKKDISQDKNIKQNTSQDKNINQDKSQDNNQDISQDKNINQDMPQLKDINQGLLQNKNNEICITRSRKQKKNLPQSSQNKITPKSKKKTKILPKDINSKSVSGDTNNKKISPNKSDRNLLRDSINNAVSRDSNNTYFSQYSRNITLTQDSNNTTLLQDSSKTTHLQNLSNTCPSRDSSNMHYSCTTESFCHENILEQSSSKNDISFKLDGCNSQKTSESTLKSQDLKDEPMSNNAGSLFSIFLEEMDCCLNESKMDQCQKKNIEYLGFGQNFLVGLSKNADAESIGTYSEPTQGNMDQLKSTSLKIEVKPKISLKSKKDVFNSFSLMEDESSVSSRMPLLEDFCTSQKIKPVVVETEVFKKSTSETKVKKEEKIGCTPKTGVRARKKRKRTPSESKKLLSKTKSDRSNSVASHSNELSLECDHLSLTGNLNSQSEFHIEEAVENISNTKMGCTPNPGVRGRKKRKRTPSLSKKRLSRTKSDECNSVASHSNRLSLECSTSSLTGNLNTQSIFDIIEEVVKNISNTKNLDEQSIVDVINNTTVQESKEEINILECEEKKTNETVPISTKKRVKSNTRKNKSLDEKGNTCNKRTAKDSSMSEKFILENEPDPENKDEASSTTGKRKVQTKSKKENSKKNSKPAERNIKPHKSASPKIDMKCKSSVEDKKDNFNSSSLAEDESPISSNVPILERVCTDQEIKSAIVVSEFSEKDSTVKCKVKVKKEKSETCASKSITRPCRKVKKTATISKKLLSKTKSHVDNIASHNNELPLQCNSSSTSENLSKRSEFDINENASECISNTKTLDGSQCIADLLDNSPAHESIPENNILECMDNNNNSDTDVKVSVKQQTNLKTGKQKLKDCLQQKDSIITMPSDSKAKNISSREVTGDLNDMLIENFNEQSTNNLSVSTLGESSAIPKDHLFMNITISEENCKIIEMKDGIIIDKIGNAVENTIKNQIDHNVAKHILNDNVKIGNCTPDSVNSGTPKKCNRRNRNSNVVPTQDNKVNISSEKKDHDAYNESNDNSKVQDEFVSENKVKMLPDNKGVKSRYLRTTVKKNAVTKSKKNTINLTASKIDNNEPEINQQKVSIGNISDNFEPAHKVNGLDSSEHDSKLNILTHVTRSVKRKLCYKNEVGNNDLSKNNEFPDSKRKKLSQKKTSSLDSAENEHAHEETQLKPPNAYGLNSGDLEKEKSETNQGESIKLPFVYLQDIFKMKNCEIQLGKLCHGLTTSLKNNSLHYSQEIYNNLQLEKNDDECSYGNKDLTSLDSTIASNLTLASPKKSILRKAVNLETKDNINSITETITKLKDSPVHCLPKSTVSTSQTMNNEKQNQYKISKNKKIKLSKNDREAISSTQKNNPVVEFSEHDTIIANSKETSNQSDCAFSKKDLLLLPKHSKDVRAGKVSSDFAPNECEKESLTSSTEHQVKNKKVFTSVKGRKKPRTASSKVRCDSKSLVEQETYSNNTVPSETLVSKEKSLVLHENTRAKPLNKIYSDSGTNKAETPLITEQSESGLIDDKLNPPKYSLRKKSALGVSTKPDVFNLNELSLREDICKERKSPRSSRRNNNSKGNVYAEKSPQKMSDTNIMHQHEVSPKLNKSQTCKKLSNDEQNFFSLSQNSGLKSSPIKQDCNSELSHKQKEFLPISIVDFEVTPMEKTSLPKDIITDSPVVGFDSKVISRAKSTLELNITPNSDKLFEVNHSAYEMNQDLPANQETSTKLISDEIPAEPRHISNNQLQSENTENDKELLPHTVNLINENITAGNEYNRVETKLVEPKVSLSILETEKLSNSLSTPEIQIPAFSKNLGFSSRPQILSHKKTRMQDVSKIGLKKLLSSPSKIQTEHEKCDLNKTPTISRTVRSRHKLSIAKLNSLKQKHQKTVNQHNLSPKTNNNFKNVDLSPELCKEESTSSLLMDMSDKFEKYSQNKNLSSLRKKENIVENVKTACETVYSTLEQSKTNSVKDFYSRHYFTDLCLPKCKSIFSEIIQADDVNEYKFPEAFIEGNMLDLIKGYVKFHLPLIISSSFKEDNSLSRHLILDYIKKQFSGIEQMCIFAAFQDQNENLEVGDATLSLVYAGLSKLFFEYVRKM